MKGTRALTSLLAIGPLAAVALHVVAACSTSDPKGPAVAEDAAADVVEELAPVEPADAGVTTCKLPKDVTTGRAICDECLQKACCAVIVACLGEAVCSALNDCMNDCRANSDASAACVRACAQGKDEPAERLVDALECQSTRCSTQCK